VPAFRLNPPYVAAALVREGAGIAVVDEFTARATAGADLDFRPLEKKSRFDVYCIHLVDRPVSRVAQEFIRAMQQSIGANALLQAMDG